MNELLKLSQNRILKIYVIIFRQNAKGKKTDYDYPPSSRQGLTTARQASTCLRSAIGGTTARQASTRLPNILPAYGGPTSNISFGA
jgi:hypothetical protein